MSINTNLNSEIASRSEFVTNTPDSSFGEKQQQYKPAGFFLRVAATLIDAFIMFGLTIVAVIGLVILIAMTGPAPRIQEEVLMVLMTLLSLAMFLVNWLYFAFLEASSRQGTLGKQLMGLRVTDISGQSLTFGRATARYIARFISWYSFGLGCLPFYSAKGQTLHDKLTDSLVVSK